MLISQRYREAKNLESTNKNNKKRKPTTCFVNSYSLGGILKQLRDLTQISFFAISS